jgi:hypothetical protein
MTGSYDLFLLCVAAMHSKIPEFIEYGPFTGKTSAFLCSIASNMDGHMHLVDNFQQGFGSFVYSNLALDSESLARITRAHVGIIPTNKFTIHNRDIIDDYLVDTVPGFIYFDVCRSKATGITARALLDYYDNDNSPMILVFDDVVSELENKSNKDYRDYFRSEWISKPSKVMKPFFVTHSKVFMSNFEMPASWTNIINLLSEKYIKKHDIISVYSGLPIWTRDRSIPNYMETYDFVYDDDFWQKFDKLI